MLWIEYRASGVVPPPLLDTEFGAFSNLVAVGDYLFITAPSDGVFYVINKANPAALGTPASFGSLNQRPIVTFSTHIAVMDVGANFRTYNISTPTSPTAAGTTTATNSAGMVYSGNRVYSADAATVGTGRIRNYSVATPTSPTLTSTLSNSLLNGVQGLAFQGSHVYAAATIAGRLVAVNISVPATMTIADTENHADLAGCVDAAINLQYVYVVGPAGLVVVDKTTPTALSYVTTVSIPNAVAIEVGGDHAFVITDDGAGTAELIIVDITTPSAPTVVSGATVSGLFGAPRDLVLDDDVLFVTDEGNGAVYAFDVLAYP